MPSLIISAERGIELRALVIEDGLSRQALAAARALRASGWEVGVGSPIRGVAAASKAVHRWHEVPSPEHTLDGFVSSTRAAISAYGYDVVVGSRDEEVAALCHYRTRLGAALPAPPCECVFQAQDKVELSRLAGLARLATPHIHADPESTFESWNESEGPKVVKPRLGLTLKRSVSNGKLPGKGGTRLVATPGEAREAIAATRAAGHDPVLQDHCEGHLGAVTIFCNERSEVVAHMEQRSSLTWPIGSGVSVRAKTVTVDEELLVGVRSLAKELGWTGLAQLQFLYPLGGEPHLIDFNGRIYGSLALAFAAGVNFPDALCRAALGLPWVARPANVGVRYHWLWGDLRRALQGPGMSIARDLAGTAAYATRATHSVWSRRDPGPSRAYLMTQLRRRATRRMLRP